MGRAISRGLRIVFQVLTSLLFLSFLLTAVGGIVMKTSTSILQATVKMAVKEYEGDAEDLSQFAAFLLEVADTVAIYSIVIGVLLAVLCLIGLIASCFGWVLMLKIHAGILTILLIAQVIVVAVVFSNPNKFANKVISSTEALLKSYRNPSQEGQRATAIWDVLMETDPQCCGMDGYKDFIKLGKSLPPPCCNITSGNCGAAKAESASVAGCRPKVEQIASLRSKILLHVSAAMIFEQALLIALLILTICTTEKEKTMEA
ncbi:Tetraspanin-6 [Taenia crassiceps]|uniref:Tetraspanin-6 n=1 Tax=Taenia crassiceps TaxID=6207 RepID=A0ABR4Q359_9CEST